MIKVSLSVIAHKKPKIYLQSDRLCAGISATANSTEFSDYNINIYCHEPALVYFALEHVKEESSYHVKGHIRRTHTSKELDIDCCVIGHSDLDVYNGIRCDPKKKLASFKMVDYGPVFEVLIVEKLGWDQYTPNRLNHYQWMLVNRIESFRASMNGTYSTVYEHPDAYLAHHGNLDTLANDLPLCRIGW